MRQVLLVANRTANSDDLAAAVTARMSAGPCQFVLLVPPAPTSSPHRRPAFGAGIAAEVPAELSDLGDFDYDAAERQRDVALERLRALGATIDGVVGDPDPMRAMRLVITRRGIDEIIISTLSSRVSRWLHQDLAGRARREFKLPVAVISPTNAAD